MYEKVERLIYKLIKNYDSKNTTYDFKLLRKSNDFTLINEIYIYDFNKKEKNIMNNDIIKPKKDKSKTSKNKSKKKINIMDIDNEEDEDIDSKINFSYEEEEKNEEIKSKTEENIHYLIISDLYRSVVLYSYDVYNDKLNEM